MTSLVKRRINWTQNLTWLRCLGFTFEMNLTILLGFTGGYLEGGRLPQPVDVGAKRRYGICLLFL